MLLSKALVQAKPVPHQSQGSCPLPSLSPQLHLWPLHTIPQTASKMI